MRYRWEHELHAVRFAEPDAGLQEALRNDCACCESQEERVWLLLAMFPEDDGAWHETERPARLVDLEGTPHTLVGALVYSAKKAAYIM